MGRQESHYVANTFQTTFFDFRIFEDVQRLPGNFVETWITPHIELEGACGSGVAWVR